MSSKNFSESPTLFQVNKWVVYTIILPSLPIFGGTQKYFGGTLRFRGTQVEKH
jgi:hypothetical protein